jgi:hypothetical protein
VSERVLTCARQPLRDVQGGKVHCWSMQTGTGGGAHGGLGPRLQLEQYLCAALERLFTSESAAPYQAVAREQPGSHEFTGSTTTHSLLLAQPYRYLRSISARCVA